MHDEHKNKTAFPNLWPFRIQYNAVWIKKRTSNVSAINELSAYRNPGTQMSRISRRYSDL